MKGLSLASRPGSLVCPLCETGQLRTAGNHTLHCESCSSSLYGGVLETLRRISTLPDALGRHACEECGHPEMRCLPDETYHCPSCGSEVLTIAASSTRSKPIEHGQAYWAEGRFEEIGTFADNPNLTRWENPSDRLAYYRGHRVGSEERPGGGKWSAPH
jgi:ribosomal protein L37AE/L43A